MIRQSENGGLEFPLFSARVRVSGEMIGGKSLTLTLKCEFKWIWKEKLIRGGGGDLSRIDTL